MTPETKLVKGILQYLELCHIMAWRNNTGAITVQGKTKRRFFRYGALGSGDIFGILPDGRFLSIEAKVGSNKPTDLQEDWIRRVNASGGLSFAAWTIDDVADAIHGDSARPA